jgi:hypothetical protein
MTKQNRRFFNTSAIASILTLMIPKSSLIASDNISAALISNEFPIYKGHYGLLGATINQTFELQSVFGVGQIEEYVEPEPSIDIEIWFYLNEEKTIQRTLSFHTNKSGTWTEIHEDWQRYRKEKIYYEVTDVKLFKNERINPVDILIDDICDIEFEIKSNKSDIYKVLYEKCKVVKTNDNDC